MTDDRTIGLALLLGLGYLVFRATSSEPATVTGFTPRDLDAAARTLWAETSMLGPSSEEHEAIVQILQNRASFHGRSVYDTANPPGTPLWNGSSIFAERWRTADEKPRFDQALEVAGRVLSGEAPNRIGPRRHFVHPGGSPRCSDSSQCVGRRLCIDGRCLPIWSVAQSQGGNAGTGGTFDPVRVGRAVFS
mgnify:CR=1 FL=1